MKAPVKDFNLLRLPLVRRVLVSRYPQFLIGAVALGGFSFAILAGLVGTPVGSRNFAIIFVWIAWWALLMLIAVPLAGRAWCGVCPIPLPGDWLQRGAVLGPEGANRRSGFGRRWPNKLRGMWLQNGAFALVALFSAVVLTQPLVTAIVLLAFLFIAIGASLLFERRAFCRYLCPVGGFIGLYSQLAPLELRVVDTAVCAAHTEKTCYTGNQAGYGCPWQVFPPGLVKNTYCGLCMECLRTCPHDNLALNLRNFGSDLGRSSGRKMDEVFKAFIMLGAALLYSAVLLGPWGALKSAAFSVGSLPWLLYAVVFLGLILGVMPGLFSLATGVGRSLSGSSLTRRQVFINQGYALVPLGMAAWVAFSLSFVFANFSYVFQSISDPLGWGWNLVGTANLSWQPYFMGAVPGLEAVIMIAGLAWSAMTSHRIAAENLNSPGGIWRQALPVSGYCLAVTLVLLWLLIG
jgi:ferredoxin